MVRKESIGSFLRRLRSQGDNYDTPRVLVVDQFEEIFTTFPERWPDREAFFVQLGQALEQDPLLRVLLAMREDYIADLDPFTATVFDELQTRFRLEPLREDPALEAVIRPLRYLGREFDEGVAEKLVEDLISIHTESGARARGEFVEPVQLQVVCRSLWRNLKSTGSQTITKDHLAKFGDVDQVLSELYENAVLEASRVHGLREGMLRSWFEQTLITPAQTRGAVFKGERETGGIPNTVIEDLEGERLLAGVLRGGARWYELAHDRLIGPIIESNRRWLLARSGAEQIRRRLEERAAYWIHVGRSEDGLLTSAELVEFEHWLDSPDAEELGVSEPMRALVLASRAAIDRQALEAERKRIRVLQRQRVVMGALLVIAVALALYSFGLRRKESSARSEASKLLHLGESRYSQADRLMALKQFEQAALVYASLNDRDGEAASVNALGRTFTDLGELEKAEVSFKRALELVRMTGDREGEALTLNNLCLVSLERRRPLEAKRYCSLALELYHEIHDVRGQVATLVNLGNTNYLLGKPQEALSVLEESISLARRISEPRLEFAAFYGLARVWRDLGNLKESERSIQAAIEIMESRQGELLSTDFGTSSLSREEAYDLYIDILMRLHATFPDAGYTARAFEASDHSRARGIVESLWYREGANQVNESGLAVRRARLVSQLNEKTVLLSRLESTSEKSERRALLVGDIQDLLAQLGNVDTLLHSKFLRSNPLRLLTLREIQDQLDNDTLLLEFDLGVERSFLWAVSRENIASFELPPKGMIEDLALSTYRRLTQDRTEEERTQAALFRLSETLLGPVEPLLYRTRLVIVPDGALASLSFAALSYPSGSINTIDKPPLVLSHSLVELPSMSLLVRLRQLGRMRDAVRGTIAVFADPVLSIDDPRIPPSASPQADASAELAPLPRLPFSLKFSGLFRPEAGGTPQGRMS